MPMPESMVLTAMTKVNTCDEKCAARNDTLSHCGTGNAGEGSKHLPDTRATLVSVNPISVFAIVVCVFFCDACDGMRAFIDGCCLALDPS